MFGWRCAGVGADDGGMGGNANKPSEQGDHTGKMCAPPDAVRLKKSRIRIGATLDELQARLGVSLTVCGSRGVRVLHQPIAAITLLRAVTPSDSDPR